MIAIIGGGITGLTKAIALHKLGFSFKLFEQAATSMKQEPESGWPPMQ
jgi:2-polyprenyl-6-methoxyphenol hydroxylase-like FAD-dependent oxidoreductase